MKKCEDLQRYFLEYMDGDLSVYKSLSFKKHLNQCDLCQHEILLYKKTWDLLDHLPDIEPDADYISRFWQKSQEKGSFLTIISNCVRMIILKMKALVRPVLILCCILLVLIYAVFLSLDNLSTGKISNEHIKIKEMEFVENIELMENLEIIQDMEFLEDLKIIETLEFLDV